VAWQGEDFWAYVDSERVIPIERLAPHSDLKVVEGRARLHEEYALSGSALLSLGKPNMFWFRLAKSAEPDRAYSSCSLALPLSSVAANGGLYSISVENWSVAPVANAPGSWPFWVLPEGY